MEEPNVYPTPNLNVTALEAWPDRDLIERVAPDALDAFDRADAIRTGAIQAITDLAESRPRTMSPRLPHVPIAGAVWDAACLTDDDALVARKTPDAVAELIDNDAVLYAKARAEASTVVARLAAVRSSVATPKLAEAVGTQIATITQTLVALADDAREHGEANRRGAGWSAIESWQTHLADARRWSALARWLDGGRYDPGQAFPVPRPTAQAIASARALLEGAAA